jgi:hypothetical protein
MTFTAPSAWLGVVCAEHVARGVSLGIAQTNHGRRTGLARMRPGDWLVYYSPHRRLGESSPVRAFTAIGRIADDEIWQADEGTFKPWRRRVDYRAEARWATVADLRDSLALTTAANWGYALRRGLIPLTLDDLATIHLAMTGAQPAMVCEISEAPAVPTHSDQRDGGHRLPQPRLW